MRRLIVLSISALLLSAVFSSDADARSGFGGGGFRGGFAGGGYRGGFVGGGYRNGFIGGGYRGGIVGSGARWGGAGIGRPGWNGAGWGFRGVRPWLGYGAAVGLGLVGAAYYNGYAPYGYDDQCPAVQQQYWDGYGYRVMWVNACDGY